MVTLPEMPDTIKALPIDDRGYPIPWFVARVNGVAEFRAADAKKLVRAVQKKLCWVCGTPLDLRQFTFVIGPMCAVNRVTAEPPCHPDCAEFSAKACPFLSRPKAVRREAGLPDDMVDPPGEMLRRNPGVACLWYCRGYELFDATGGQLFRIANPAKVPWFAEGRSATRAEIMESIETGLVQLRQMAAKDGQRGLNALDNAVRDALKFVPAA